jgi:cytochrome c oxidase cbb3-type subunit 2
MSHEKVEKNAGLLIVLTLLVISVGGLIEIVPLILSSAKSQGSTQVVPRTALEQIRPCRSETERYGPYSVAAESQYDHPFEFGSKRTGPDLARVGGRYSDDWHRLHLHNPRDVVPESNMPGYPWLARTKLDSSITERKLRILRSLGTPYSDADLASAKDAVTGKTEQDAVIAYLQSLGLARPRGMQVSEK